MSIILRKMQKSCNYVDNADSDTIVSLAKVGDEGLRIDSHSRVTVKYTNCQPTPIQHKTTGPGR